MSVNLNILANKAIRGTGEVNDISCSMQMYVSGSPYIVYAVNNFAGVPYTNIPPTSSYCSSSIIEWSPDSTFSTGVTSSAQNCNSSSLSGSLLWYGSFANNDQSGGVLQNYLGYEVTVFDTTIPNVNPNLSGSTSIPNKTYYFRSIKSGPFLSGSFTGTVSSSLAKNVAIVSGSPFNPNENCMFRTYKLFEATGYNEATNTWYSNYPPTAPVNLNINRAVHFPANSLFDVPTAFGHTASIVTGSGFPTIVKYGNLGSDALKTNGGTFTFPIDSTGDTTPGVNFQICVIEGSVSMTFADGGGPTNQQISVNCGNTYTLPLPGSEVYGSLKTGTAYRTGLATRNGIISWQRTKLDSAGITGNRLFVNGTYIADDQYPYFTPQVTLYTSANCVLRFIAMDAWPYYTQERWQQVYPSWATTAGQAVFYQQNYGSYTGSLSGN